MRLRLPGHVGRMRAALTPIPSSLSRGAREAWLSSPQAAVCSLAEDTLPGDWPSASHSPIPCFSLRFTKQCPSPEAWLPPKSVSGGETEAREWIGHSAWLQTAAQLLLILVHLPEAQRYQGSRQAPGKPVPQKTALGWGTAGEEKADLSAWENLSHSTTGLSSPRECWEV